MTLEHKLEDFCKYDFKNFGVGRLLLVGTLHNEFGLDLTNSEISQIGDKIEQRIEKDFQLALIPEVQRVLAMGFGKQLPSLEQLEKSKIHTELELLDLLSLRQLPQGLQSQTIQSIRGLDSNKNNIRGICSTLVDMYLVDGKELDIYGLDYFIMRKKTIPSLAEKYLSRISRLLAPTDCILNEIQSDNIHRTPIGKNTVKQITLVNLSEHLKSGSDLFSEHYNNSPTHKDVNFKQVREIGNPQKLIQEQLLGKKYNSYLGDLFVIDAVGVNYAFSEDFTKRQLIKTINANSTNVLPSKCEDNLDLGVKDKAQVWGHKGFVQGSYYETRLQETIYQYEGKFGSTDVRPHFEYDQRQLNDRRERTKGSMIMKEIEFKIQLMFNKN
jgi:hypothetical protein